MLDLAQKTDVICFGSLASRCENSRLSLLTFLEATRQDALKVLGLNLCAPFYEKGIIEKLLEKTNVLKLNGEERPIRTSMFN